MTKSRLYSRPETNSVMKEQAALTWRDVWEGKAEHLCLKPVSGGHTQHSEIKMSFSRKTCTSVHLHYMLLQHSNFLNTVPWSPCWCKLFITFLLFPSQGQGFDHFESKEDNLFRTSMEDLWPQPHHNCSPASLWQKQGGSWKPFGQPHGLTHSAVHGWANRRVSFCNNPCPSCSVNLKPPCRSYDSGSWPGLQPCQVSLAWRE